MDRGLCRSRRPLLRRKRFGGDTGGNYRNNPGPYPSLGKFYEYRDLRPGPFGDLHFATGSRDGLYQIDFWAKNIGYNDQSYYLNFSQAGVQYLGLGFDQTPHIYNDNATTLFQGAGTNNLTIPLGVRTLLNGYLAAPTNTAGIANTVEGNLNGFNLGFQRYNGNADYRWTPNDNWDVNVNYNITRRDGTQPMGALTYNGQERGGRIIAEVPKPIQDTTHNANLDAEYAGMTPWGNKFNVRAGYMFSAYRDDNASFGFQNPYVLADSANAQFNVLNNTMSMAPDNSANTWRLNGGVDLPWKSRYIGAVNYTMGRQDQGFLPFATIPGVVGCTGASPAPCVSLGVPPTISGSSSFGNNTLLVNNVLTTSWTSELKQTSRYRYYDFDGSHAPVTISYMLLADSANAAEAGGKDAFGIAYTKQNAGTEFVWHPKAVRWLTVGAGAGWEQWDRHQRNGDYADVNITNEVMGKVFFDAKPWAWARMRGSYIHAERRYDGTYQELTPNGTDVYPGWRNIDMANRNRDKANLSWEFVAPNGFVIMPTGGFRFDDYTHDGANGDPLGLSGIQHDNSWNAGLTVSWKFRPGAVVFGSYVREEAHRELRLPFQSHSLPAAANIPFGTNMDDTIHTFITGINLALIPEKLDLKVAYTYMTSDAAISGQQGPWPKQTDNLNRLDVQAKYKIDPAVTQQLGWKGETYVKMRYLWESNSASDWATVDWNYFRQFDSPANTTNHIFLGWNNPNYNVQVLALSVGVKW